MKSQDTIEHKEEIEERIGQKRMKHSMRVAAFARELALRYGEDPEKAYIAGFYHDCMKIRDRAHLIKTAKDYQLPWSQDYDRAPQLIHSFLGALVAEKRYGVKDRDVLNAIAYHTTGRAGMSTLEKIVYLADYAEPARNFEGVEEARRLIDKDLNLAMLYALDHTICFLIDKKSYITGLSIRARNDILKETAYGEVL